MSQYNRTCLLLECIAFLGDQQPRTRLFKAKVVTSAFPNSIHRKTSPTLVARRVHFLRNNWSESGFIGKGRPSTGLPARKRTSGRGGSEYRVQRNMKPKMYWYARHVARFSRLPRDTSAAAWQLPGLLAIVVVVLLLQPGTLFGQQAWPGNQGWSQNDRYNDRIMGKPRQISSQNGNPTMEDSRRPYYPDSGQAYAQQGRGQGAAQAQPLIAVQLEQLVAPIALYPDALVAQVLAAATYPGQVADADQWRQAQGDAAADRLRPALTYRTGTRA